MASPLTFVFWILVRIIWDTAKGLDCGYPGAPAFGRPHPVKETYRPGDAVSFTCAVGYSLQGPLQRVCAPNGTWAGPLPLCDRSLSIAEQQVSSRQTLSLYPASKAIDGDARSCTYTDKIRPRWVRLDMRTDHRVRAVSITVPHGIYTHDAAQLTIYTIRVRDNTTAAYHKCASFNGRFASSTLQLSCSGGEAEGRYIHVEDNRHRVDYFSLCEIQVFVNKGSYECGEADRPAHAYSIRTHAGEVEYRCVYGYRLEGPTTRACGSDGQWANPQPICREIVCPSLGDVPNGRVVYSGRQSDRHTLGTKANVSCDYGYQGVGEPLVCGQDARWSQGNISCRAVDCGQPPTRHESERHEMLNGTRYGSVALLRCGDLQAALLCREDGTWTPPGIDCAAHSGVSTLGLIEEQSDVPTGIVIGMAVVVFVLLLTVVFVLLLKRKKVLRQNSTDSIPSKETTPSSAQPFENDAFYATIPASSGHASSKSPSLLSTVLFPRRHKTPPTKSSDDSGNSSASCIYEEIGGIKKGVETPPSDGGTKPESPPIPSSTGQPEAVYARVDLEEKRRSRLVRSLCDRFQPVDPPPWEGGTYRPAEEEPLDEVDLEPIKLRELPPIPDDGVTYAKLSPPLEPSPTLTRRNEIYEGSTVPSKETVMKDNELYLTNATLKL